MGLVVLAAMLVATVQAEPRHRHHRQNHNWIIERQTNYQVPSGSVPTERLIIGRREIDVYSDGTMFEGDHMVGVKH